MLDHRLVYLWHINRGSSEDIAFFLNRAIIRVQSLVERSDPIWIIWLGYVSLTGDPCCKWSWAMPSSVSIARDSSYFFLWWKESKTSLPPRCCFWCDLLPLSLGISWPSGKLTLLSSWCLETVNPIWCCTPTAISWLKTPSSQLSEVHVSPLLSVVLKGSFNLCQVANETD